MCDLTQRQTLRGHVGGRTGVLGRVGNLWETLGGSHPAGVTFHVQIGSITFAR